MVDWVKEWAHDSEEGSSLVSKDWESDGIGWELCAVGDGVVTVATPNFL